jgi:hypothetical protein
MMFDFALRARNLGLLDTLATKFHEMFGLEKEMTVKTFHREVFLRQDEIPFKENLQ